MIEIDGSYGEGGGQILRTALSMSVMTGQPVRIYNIRKNRPKKGLQMQHLAAVRALKQVSNADVEGVSLGSEEVVFRPGTVRPGSYHFDIKTAGSTVLLTQAVLPALLFAGRRSNITVEGGTHVPFSPTYEEYAYAFLPVLEMMGAHVEPRILRYGFYPRGGGRITSIIEPVKELKGVILDRPIEEKTNVSIIIGGLPEHVAKRERAVILKHYPDANIKINRVDSLSPGNAVIFHRFGLGIHSLGRRGKPAEEVAEEVCKEYEREKMYPVDKHTADQVMLYMALAKERSRIITSEITQHAKTHAWIIEQFTDRKFYITDNKIECR